MKISLMKAVDHSIGAVICILLNIYETIVRLLKPKSIMGTPKNILVTKYFGMGSILLAIPMCEALRKQHPTARIIFLTFANNKRFCELLKIADEIIPIRTNHILVFIIDVLSALYQLQRRRIDIAIDLEFFSKFSTIVTYLSGARVRVGFYLRVIYRGNLLTHRVYYNHYKHISRIFLALGEAAGARIGSDKIVLPALTIPEKGKTNLEALFQQYTLQDSDKIVVLNVNASELAYERRWPAENFVRLINRLVQNYPRIKFILIGSSKEREYVKSLVARVKGKNKIINLAGEMDIDTLYALLERNILFIGNDSGPLHIAAALRRPTISFFGPETPTLYGPLGDNHIVFYQEIYCSPCMSAYNVKTAMCRGENRCMQKISFEKVASTVEKKLEEIP